MHYIMLFIDQEDSLQWSIRTVKAIPTVRARIGLLPLRRFGLFFSRAFFSLALSCITPSNTLIFVIHSIMHLLLRESVDRSRSAAAAALAVSVEPQPPQLLSTATMLMAPFRTTISPHLLSMTKKNTMKKIYRVYRQVKIMMMI
jgi:hypothetical protein